MRHRCHWPTCNKEIPPRLWGCRSHWYTLPPDIRADILSAYVKGQETTKSPTARYLDATRTAQRWIKEYLNTPEGEADEARRRKKDFQYDLDL